jgi:hypothetical protein
MERNQGRQDMTEAVKLPNKKAIVNPSRREFGILGAAAAAIGWTKTASAEASVKLPVAKHKAVVPATVGQANGLLFRPETGEHPGLVMYASASASKRANAAVAEQLSSQGWAVLLVDAPASADPVRINRDNRAHVEWLVAQPGVSAAPAPASKKHGFVLQSFSAAQPKLSLASREERQTAACTGVLFAAPAVVLARAEARRESLNGAARSLYRLAA